MPDLSPGGAAAVSGTEGEAAMTRRTALSLVASLLARGQAQTQTTRCAPVPETLTLNFGSGACTVKSIRVVQGARTVTIPVSAVLDALGATTPVR